MQGRQNSLAPELESIFTRAENLLAGRRFTKLDLAQLYEDVFRVL